MKTTETSDMMLPTDRSMPPVRITQTCPRPTASRMVTALRMVDDVVEREEAPVAER